MIYRTCSPHACRSSILIKELMRRTVQFYIERKGTGPLIGEDVSQALDEMLVSGGSLNLKLLEATEAGGTPER